MPSSRISQPATSGDTTARLLDAAQRMIQHRGYNAFSYHDLADEVGIRTASIHYHFKTKADMGEALIKRYVDTLETNLANLDRCKRTDRARLKGFIDSYRETSGSDAICLCGSMAADFETMTPAIHQGVRAYLERSELWVKEKIDSGQREGEFDAEGQSCDLAGALLAGLQGALLVTRARRNSGSTSANKVLDRVEKTFFESLKGSAT